MNRESSKSTNRAHLIFFSSMEICMWKLFSVRITHACLNLSTTTTKNTPCWIGLIERKLLTPNHTECYHSQAAQASRKIRRPESLLLVVYQSMQFGLVWVLWNTYMNMLYETLFTSLGPPLKLASFCVCFIYLGVVYVSLFDVSSPQTPIACSCKWPWMDNPGVVAVFSEAFQHPALALTVCSLTLCAHVENATCTKVCACALLLSARCVRKTFPDHTLLRTAELYRASWWSAQSRNCSDVSAARPAPDPFLTDLGVWRVIWSDLRLSLRRIMWTPLCECWSRACTHMRSSGKVVIVVVHMKCSIVNAMLSICQKSSIYLKWHPLSVAAVWRFFLDNVTVWCSLPTFRSSHP